MDTNQPSSPQIPAGENASASRRYFSHSHRLAAYLAGSRAAELEEAAIANRISVDDPNHLVEQQALVISSIVSSFAFLEALINELLADSHDPRAEIILHMSISSDAIKALADLRRRLAENDRRTPTLSKYRCALEATGKDPFAPGQQPMQTVRLVGSLRNYLVHNEPFWTDEETKAITKLQGGLRALNLGRNPLALPSRATFPDHVLHSHVAHWAHSSAIKFATEFWSRMGLQWIEHRGVVHFGPAEISQSYAEFTPANDQGNPPSVESDAPDTIDSGH